MKLFLVGATGRTGKWILKAALAGGHQVTALVRDPTDRLGISHPSLSVVSGDLFTVQNLVGTLSGHDAVISALNSGAVETGTQKLIAAAETAGVKRFFGFAGGGILQLDENRLRRDRPGYPEIFLKSSARHLQAWKALEASSLNWTLICTPDIANTAATGQAKFRADYMPTGGNSVAAGDIAEFLLTELDAGLFSRKRVGFTI
jgi:uncharacterized protein